jgi:predicted DNA-binding protein YlxM (UPF0122 family)
MAPKGGNHKEKRIKNAPFTKILLEKSLLDQKTLQILLLYYSGEARSFEEIAGKMGMGRSGVWKRWKRGVESLKRAFYTLELALYLGLLEEKIAELVLEDLSDYLDLRKGRKTPEEVRENLQRRMLQALRGEEKGI